MPSGRSGAGGIPNDPQNSNPGMLCRLCRWRPSLAPYVTGTGGQGRGDRRRRAFMLSILLWRFGSSLDLERAHNPKVAGSNPAPATMNDEGLADATAANPFRLPRLHPGIGAPLGPHGATRL